MILLIGLAAAAAQYGLTLARRARSKDYVTPYDKRAALAAAVFVGTLAALLAWIGR